MASSLSFLRSSLSSSLLFLRGRTRNEIQLLPQLQQQQIRWNWQVKIRQRLNPQTGEMEDIGNSRMWLAGADNRVQRKWPKHPSPRPWGVGWDSSVLCAQMQICTNQRGDSRVHLTWCFDRSWTLDANASCRDFDLTLSLSNTLFILIIARFFIHDDGQTNKSIFIGFWFLQIVHVDATTTAFADRFLHYEKPWMKKKRLKISSVLMRRAQAVNNLVAYIKVKRDFKKKRDEWRSTVRNIDIIALVTLLIRTQVNF